MSSTRQASPHREIKAEEDGDKENRVHTPHSAHQSSRKRVRTDSAASGGTSTRSSVEEGMPASSNINGASTPLTHTVGDFKRLQQLLVDSIMFREHLNDENQRLLRELRVTRRELFKTRALMKHAAERLHEQASRRIQGIDSDDEAVENAG
ncbi:hypothetical protein R3P38DRAFT_3218120 [Favolaschia claudopus]|uniref:Uncharacterized protein n=1 Tax=Favolaschia claudopus TaxID=2862362 RepID=A0AAW0A405_9AGAR